MIIHEYSIIHHINSFTTIPRYNNKFIENFMADVWVNWVGNWMRMTLLFVFKLPRWFGLLLVEFFLLGCLLWIFLGWMAWYDVK